MAETLTSPDKPETTIDWPSSSRGEPTWGVARLYPRQGEWTQTDFFALPDARGIELVDGCLEFLPMPTRQHQTLIGQFYIALTVILDIQRVQLAGYNLETRNNALRQPDVLATNRLSDFPNDRAGHADLAIEIISPGPENRRRDEVEKRTEYAKAGVNEYWIVDPENRSILVLSLNGDAYTELGKFTAGQTATSKVIEGFAVSVDECFAALDN